MTQEHPITPPPELVWQWLRSGPADAAACNAYEHHIATEAARWGADQELEACCEWLDDTDCEDPQEVSLRLRWHRRPKPPSLKEQALKAIGVPTKFGEARVIEHREHELIRRALEALDD